MAKYVKAKSSGVRTPKILTRGGGGDFVRGFSQHLYCDVTEFMHSFII